MGVTLWVDPPTLDPTLDSVLGLILAQVMEGLYRFRGDGTLEPDHFVRLPYPGVAYMGLNLRRLPTDKLFAIPPTRPMALP